MTPLKCLIIDDEPIARKIIREYVADIRFLELVGEAENPIRTRHFLAEHAVDLIFLDVEMPGMNGIEFLRLVHPSTLTILTTAYPQYALQGYELDVLDYLVKPISFERFLKAVQKAQHYHQLTHNSSAGPAPAEAIFIKCERKIERIQVDDILYVKAMANYVVLHTAQRKYIAYQSMKGMEEKLPAGLFVRIHKSYLVALPAISSIDHHQVLLGETALPVSKSYRQAALEKIDPFLIRR
jgi:DNA-binding LytR/AlgR family response regulator